MTHLKVSVDIELVVRRLGIANGAVPSGFPFVHLQEETGVETLKMVTLGGTTGNLRAKKVVK